MRQLHAPLSQPRVTWAAPLHTAVPTAAVINNDTCSNNQLGPKCPTFPLNAPHLAVGHIIATPSCLRAANAAASDFTSQRAASDQVAVMPTQSQSEVTGALHALHSYLHMSGAAIHPPSSHMHQAAVQAGRGLLFLPSQISGVCTPAAGCVSGVQGSPAG